MGSVIEHTVEGLRKPGTDIGSWQGAWVVSQLSDGSISTAVFQDGRDYVSGRNKITWAMINEMRSLYLGKGWKPMTRDDIRSTSGI